MSESPAQRSLRELVGDVRVRSGQAERVYRACLAAIPTLADAEVPCDQASPWRDPEGQIRADYLRDDGHDYPVILQAEGCGEHLDVTGGLSVKYLPQSYCDECCGADDYVDCGPFCPLCSYCCGC